MSECSNPNCNDRVYLEGKCYLDFKRSDRLGAQIAMRAQERAEAQDAPAQDEETDV